MPFSCAISGLEVVSWCAEQGQLNHLLCEGITGTYPYFIQHWEPIQDHIAACSSEPSCSFLPSLRVAGMEQPFTGRAAPGAARLLQDHLLTSIKPHIPASSLTPRALTDQQWKSIFSF